MRSQVGFVSDIGRRQPITGIGLLLDGGQASGLGGTSILQAFIER
jgi:hypothetical protein